MLHATILTAILSFGATVLGAPTSEANPAPIPETASSLEARSGEYLGGIDMDTACAEQWGGLGYTDVDQRGNTCNAWNCSVIYPTLITGLSVDVNRACTKQHGVSAYGWCTTDAWGWGCYKN
jgi:hypothetical protein